jgi:Arc/MetJ family transcription regulator
MPRLIRQTMLMLVLTSTALAVGGAQRPAVSGTAPLANTSAASNATADLRPEVRLRRLHLMRPDLIPYPLAYEVIC